MRPERDALEIRFPRVEGYRVELPEERLDGRVQRRLGPGTDARPGRPVRSRGTRASSAKASTSTWSTSATCGRPRCSSTSPSACSTPSGAIPARSRSSTCSASSSASPSNGSTPAWSARAAPTRRSSCTRSWPTWPATASPPASPRASSASDPIKAVLDPYNPTGSTRHVHFNTSQDRPLGDRAPRRCHVNWVILDSDWEAEFCRVAESHPRVRAYVKNHNLGLEVPYRYGSRDAQVPARLHRAGGRRPRRRRPAAPGRRDQGLPARGRQGEEVDDGDLLGARREQPRHATAAGPSPSSPRSIEIEADFKAKVESEFNKMIDVRHRHSRRTRGN